MRAVIQDAVIELAAVAVRAGVLHQHVVIEVLLAIADEEAVNQALSTLSSQYGVHVVAHQPSAKKHRVGCNAGASSLLDPQRGDIERLPVLTLHHVMRDDGAVACHKFRNRVTECGALAHRDIVLNYGGLALFLSHNQVARMAHERRVRRSRNEQQENRIFDDCALADMYVRSVLGKGGVQRTESITTSIEITAQMRFNCTRIAVDLLCQATYLYTGWHLANRREFPDEVPVNKHQLARGALNTELFQLLLWQLAILRQFERSPCNGGDVSKPPILVVGGRETYFAETCERILAEPPIVRNHNDGAIWTAHRIDSVRHDPERVNVEAGIGFIQDRQLRFQHGHLQNLVALLFPAGEALIH